MGGLSWLSFTKMEKGITKQDQSVPRVFLPRHHDGRQKDILSVWSGAHKSSKFWLNALNGLKSRKVLDVYLLCVDGLNTGVFPVVSM